MHSPRSSARREQSSSATPPQQWEPLPAPIPSIQVRSDLRVSQDLGCTLIIRSKGSKVCFLPLYVLCTYEELHSAESFGRGVDGKAGHGVLIIDILDKLAVSLIGVDPLLDEEDFLLPFNDCDHCICELKFRNILYW